MNLTNEDTGAVGGADADGGEVRTAKTVLLDLGSTYGENVLRGFEETFEDVQPDGTAGRDLAFQVGAQARQTIDVSLGAVNIQALGLSEVDLSKDPRRAIVHIDQALDYLNRERAKVGAQLARLDSAVGSLQTASENQSASRSRILDADYAEETAGLLRAQIIQQAATSMLAQANALPQMALQLLR
jgi:flagellin